MNFTNTNISNCPVGTVIKDKQVPGLMFRKGKQRSSFYIYYRDTAGKERRPVIGTHPILDVKAARELALLKLQEAQMGHVLSGSKTFADAYEEYMRVDATKFKLSTLRAYRGYWRNYIEPALGTRPIHKVTYQELQDLHGKIKGVRMPNKVIGMIGRLYIVAKRNGWYSGEAPTDLVIRNKEKRRKRHMTLEEFKKFGEVLSRWSKSNRAARSDFSQLVLLLLHTACRKTELLDMRWEYIHWDQGLIILPESKTEDDKHIALSAKAIEILKRIAERHISTWSELARTKERLWAFSEERVMAPKEGRVFPGLGDHQRLWAYFRDEAGFPDLTIHDLRRSAASAGFSNGMEKSHVGAVLGHSDSSTTDGYAFLMIEKQRNYANKLSEAVDTLISGDVE